MLFRHVLWIHLEDRIASALAHILAVIDGDNNLDKLISDQPSEKADFWLNVFQEDQWDLLHIPVTTSVLYVILNRGGMCFFYSL